MHRHTWKENLISLLIGGILGLIVSILSHMYQTPTYKKNIEISKVDTEVDTHDIDTDSKLDKDKSLEDYIVDSYHVNKEPAETETSEPAEVGTTSETSLDSSTSETSSSSEQAENSAPATSTTQSSAITEGANSSSTISDNDKKLLANLVWCEAGNQDLHGKRLVVDVVLNRVRSSAFPNSISEVIYQKNQFSPVLFGIYDASFGKATDECNQAVELELQSELDTNIMYFTSIGYSKYGTPAYKYQDHWFSYE